VQGAYDVVLRPAAGAGNAFVYFDTDCNWTWSAGATLTLEPADAASRHVQIEKYNPTVDLPPTIINGANETALVEFTGDDMLFESLTMTEGTLNTGGIDLTTTADLTGTGGSITATGSTVAVGGDLDVDSVDLTGGTWNVTGAATAANATITTSDFSGGTELDATDNCTDGLGNTNVDFGVQASTTACLFLL
jgi:hypothetical protein